MKMTTPLLRVIHLSIRARVIKPLCFSATSDILSNNERFLSNNGITLYYLDFFLPNTPFSIAPPILRSKPCLVVGIPTLRAILPFKALIPTARLSENDNPGIFITTLSYTKTYYNKHCTYQEQYNINYTPQAAPFYIVSCACPEHQTGYYKRDVERRGKHNTASDKYN